MKKAYEGEGFTLYHGSMLDMLEEIEKESIDSIVTDPPYELNFMNKGWDNSGIAFDRKTWGKCLEVLKPGGYLLAFGGSRTYHRIACAIEDAGFEIRDTIMWLYGSGFPKSLNIANSIEGKLKLGSANKKDYKHLDGEKGTAAIGYSKTNAEDGYRPKDYNGQETTIRVEHTTEEAKKWEGWGTALKPSYEPVIVARKPFKGSCIDNVMKYGVGGLNIEECRIENAMNEDLGRKNNVKSYGGVALHESNTPAIDRSGRYEGRFPANTIFTYDETDIDEVCEGFPEVKTARYFYCAKASRRDRDEGLAEFPLKQKYYCDGSSNSLEIFGTTDGGRKPIKNIHPTVKPTALMQYLIRLVTPKGGTILDPFNGSGSTGKAAMFENKDRGSNYKYIGIELTEEYIPIAKARILFAIAEETEEDKQMTIYDFMKENTNGR